MVVDVIEQFKSAYEIHPWVRRICWGSMLVASILLLHISGGIPPHAWLVLLEALTRLSGLWMLRGPAILLPLAIISIQSLTWIIIWSLLILGTIASLRHWLHMRQEQQQFTRDLVEAQEAVIQKIMDEEHISRPGRYDNTEVSRTEGTIPWQKQLTLRLQSSAGWDRGIVRQYKPNEDSFITLQGTCIYNEQPTPFGLFIVADGMGGHAYGQDASYLAVQSMLRTVLPRLAGSNELSDHSIVELLAQGVQNANHAIYQRSLEHGDEMGATITAALVIDTTAYVVNVGDSRTYLYRASEGLSQITCDHSVVAQLVAAGAIAPDDIYTHPERNRVYRGLGGRRNVEVDWFTLPLQADDRLLLCSDGLWEMVRDPDIERLLKQPCNHPSRISQAFIEAALDGGGQDNISVIVVHLAPASI